MAHLKKYFCLCYKKHLKWGEVTHEESVSDCTVLYDGAYVQRGLFCLMFIGQYKHT